MKPWHLALLVLLAALAISAAAKHPDWLSDSPGGPALLQPDLWRLSQP